MFRSFLRAAALVPFSALLCAAPAHAQVDSVEECKAAAEQGERLRAEAKLVAARTRLLGCARESCPTVLREACIRMFTEVEAALPTVIVRARDVRGRDVIRVRVLVDGVPLLDSLTGRSVPVDPGPHRVRYEVSGAPAVEEDLLIAEGDRQRPLTVTFGVPLKSDGSWDPPSQPPPPPAQATGADRSPSIVPIAVAGAIGAVGLGAFTYLHLSAWGEYRDLDASCGTSGCPEEDIDGVRTRLIAADVFLGVGIAGVGVAAVLALLRLRSPEPSSRAMLRLDGHAGKRAAGATLWGSF